MGHPPLPAEAELRPGETLLGQWVFEHDLRRAPARHFTAMATLTNRRLILLVPPRAAAIYRVTAMFFHDTAEFVKKLEFGKWHVVMNSELKGLPQPTLDTQMTPTAIVSGPRVLSVGGKNFPVGTDPRADEMLIRFRSQWTAVNR